MNAIASAALAIAVFASTPAWAATAPKRPNIVILLADDWGYSDVGAFGSEIRTPHLDALARAGVRFSNFHVAGSCSPTRAMLQTGVSSHRAGLGNMPETIPPEHVGKPGYDQVLSRNVVTIASLLRDGGYRTYLTGKWHLGKSPDLLPTARGYDRAFSLADAGADNFEQRPIEGMYDKANWTEDGKPATLPKDYYSSTFVIDKAIEYIEAGRATGKPFLASVNFLANHTPVQAPDAYIARYDATYQGGWTKLRADRAARAQALGLIRPGAPFVTMATTDDWAKLDAETRREKARIMAAYAGMAEAMDFEIGRLVAYLKARGEYENTIFLFLSDNGAEALDPMDGVLTWLNSRANYDTGFDAIGRRGSLTAIGRGWASAAASPLRGYKFTASEGGLRVPLIMAWPGNPAVKPGRIASGFAFVTDIAPTLLDLAGVPGQAGQYAGRAVEPMTGANLTPLLTGAAETVRPPDATLGYELSGNAALFKGDLKLVRNLPPTGDGRWELFDIVKDPGETRDLSAALPQEFAAMQVAYAEFARSDRVLPMPEGYTAAGQITANAFRTNRLPKLLAALPWVLGGIAAIGFLLFWRRRRAARIDQAKADMIGA